MTDVKKIPISQLIKDFDSFWKGMSDAARKEYALDLTKTLADAAALVGAPDGITIDLQEVPAPDGEHKVVSFSEIKGVAQ